MAAAGTLRCGLEGLAHPIQTSTQDNREHSILGPGISCGSPNSTATRVAQQNGSCTSGIWNGKQKSKLSEQSCKTETNCSDNGSATQPHSSSSKAKSSFTCSSSDNSGSEYHVVLFHVEIANKRIENVPVRTDCQLAHVGNVIGENESVKVVYYLYEKLQKESCDIEDAEVMVRLRPNWKCINLNDLVDDTSATLEEVFGEMLVNGDITLCLVPPKKCLYSVTREKSTLDDSTQCEMKQSFKDLFSCFTIQELVDSNCPFSMDFLLDVYRGRYSCLSSVNNEEHKQFTDWMTVFRAKKNSSEHHISKTQAPPLRMREENSQPLARLRANFDPVTEIPLLNSWFEADQRPEHDQIARYTAQLNLMRPGKRSLPLQEKSVCRCQQFRWMSRIAAQTDARWVRRPRTRLLNKRGALGINSGTPSRRHKQMEKNTILRKETLSSGAREIIIEPMGQNPAFHPDNKLKERVSSFKALGLREDVLQGLDSMSVTQPTVIQMVTIPYIVKRHHVLCAAQTGSGKTLAYLAPIVHHLREEEVRHGFVARMKRPRACVVVPARELAAQVLQVTKCLSHHARFRSIGLIGGRKQKWMKSNLEAPVDVIVATPGTLLKYRQKDKLFFSDLTYLVLDEADTLFDDSFRPLTMELLERITVREVHPPSSTSVPVDTQVTIVGATFPKESVVNMLTDLLPELKTCTSGLHRVLPHVKHKFVKLQQHEKADKLVRLLEKDTRVAGKRTIVFCNTAACCDWLGHYLDQQELSFIRLHGNIPPKQRCDLFEQFQEGKARTLICTDIVSRGLDTSDVGHVINFDFPTNLMDYIHRVGRTGRVAGSSCQTGQSEATSFLTHNRDVRMARSIQNAAKRNQSLDVRAAPEDNSKIPARKSRIQIRSRLGLK